MRTATTYQTQEEYNNNMEGAKESYTLVKPLQHKQAANIQALRDSIKEQALREDKKIRRHKINSAIMSIIITLVLGASI